MTLVPADPATGGWIAPRLAAFGSCFGAVVPLGFEAYVRILHPVQTGADAWASWAEIAARHGTLLTALSPYWRVAGGARYGDRAAEEPLEGCLPEHTFLALTEVLAAQSPGGTGTPCVAAMWHGFGAFRDSARTLVTFSTDGSQPARQHAAPPSPYPRSVIDGPTLELPHREYWTFECTLATAAEPSRYDLWEVGDRAGWQSPQLLWPLDRSWCVATEVDDDSTLVGGSAGLVARILDDPRFEAFAIDPADDVALH